MLDISTCYSRKCEVNFEVAFESSYSVLLGSVK